MRSTNKSSVSGLLRRPLFLSGLLGMIAFFFVSAWGDDRDILEQLYRQIMSSPNVMGSIDTAVPTAQLKAGGGGGVEKDRLDIPDLQSVNDPASEKLRQEIQKMVEEAKYRHDDAVKFMQDKK